MTFTYEPIDLLPFQEASQFEAGILSLEKCNTRMIVSATLEIL